MTKEGPVPARVAYWALTLLILINLFNYLDRQIVAAVLPEISRDLFDEGDEFRNTKAGFLYPAFLVTYMLLAPVFGRLSEHISQWKIVGMAVLVWSLASGGSGLPWPPDIAYPMMLLMRSLVGVGEAAFGPVAPAMIAQFFPEQRRGQMMASFYLAIPVGGALGYAFGDIVSRNLDWRWAFYLVTPPGVLLALWCFLWKDPPRQRKQTTAPEPFWSTCRKILATTSYFFNCAGMTCMSFAMAGLALWMPTYLKFRQVGPFLGMDARIFFGILTASAGLLGTVAGGFLGDRLKPAWPGSYFLVSGWAMIVGFPMAVALLFCPFPYAWIFVFGAVFCLFVNTGPTNAIIANVITPLHRATAFALNILIIQLLGGALSGPLIGFVADVFKGHPDWLGGNLVDVSADMMDKHGNLHMGFVIVSFAMLAGGVFWLMGSRHLERDTLRASEG